MSKAAEASARLQSANRFVALFEKPPKSTADTAGVDLSPISAAQGFQLQGPAAVKLVYVTHPRNEDRLVPFAEYDEELARDKLNEALRIVNMLGASHVIARAERSSHASFKARAKAGPLRGGSAERKKSGESEFAYEGHRVGSPPRDPSHLLYPDEPGFHSAVYGALINGARSVRIEIRGLSVFTVSGDLGVSLKKVGFQLGATSETRQFNFFVIEAEFGSAVRLAPRGG